MTLLRGSGDTPDLQTQVLIPRTHLESLKKGILDALKRHAGLSAIWEYSASVDFASRLAQRANLPACVFTWRVLDDGSHLGALPRAIGWSTVESTLLFSPKFSGTTTHTQPGYLVDTSQTFDDFLRKVRGGDIAVKVQDVADGVQVLAQTKVVSVEAGNRRVRVQDDIFPAGTRYEIHWPQDACMVYNTSRRVRLTLDLYADPQAAYGSGKTIEELDRKCRAWWQTHLASIVLQLHEAEMLEEYRSTNLSDLLGDAARSGLHRIRGEVELLVGEVVGIPWPTVESVQHTGRAMLPDGSLTCQEVAQTTEDDSQRMIA